MARSLISLTQLERIFGGFRKVMTDNWLAVKDADYRTLRISLDKVVKDFIVAADKRKADKVFRIHHDGDFFSREYASAWAWVIRRNPSVHFWAYTRSFTPAMNVTDILAGIPNLTLYLSVDVNNAEWASEITGEFGDILVATLTETAAEGAEVMAGLGYNRPGAACPEVLGRIPLITVNGGACFSCQLCVKGKANIRFASKGK
jgi:Gene product 88